MQIAYIIGTFPFLTTTFIDREINMLKQMNVDLTIVSIRRPRADMPLSQEQRALQQEVTYLLPPSWRKLLVSHSRFFVTHPKRYISTIIYLLTRQHPNPKTRLMTWFHFSEGVCAAEIIRQQGCDHIHAHFVDRAATVALTASRLLEKPYSLTAHANDIYVNPVLLTEKLSNAEFVTTCTRYNMTQLSAILGAQVSSKKLHLAYHGLDTAIYAPPPKAETDQPLILSIGRLTEKKGFPYLIAACRQLRDRGYRFTCEIVGGGPEHQALETMISDLRLADTVILQGPIPHEEVIEKYSRATLFVLPCVLSQDGDRDGIPNVLMEAMAMQIPVVSTRHSGIPELIQDGVNGLLVPPGAPEPLTDAMTALLDSPDLRKRLGQQGREKIARDFDLAKNIASLYALFTAHAKCNPPEQNGQGL